MNNPQFNDYLDTPLGPMEISATEQGINSIYFVDTTRPPKRNNLTDQARQQLNQYFSGDRTDFDLPLDQQGTDFQKSVWQALIKIAYGKTCSYADIANTINNPKAVRAVGAANGKNPLTIVVPCHRVIGSDGSLTGYASGVDRKTWLLQHEGVKINHSLL